MPPSSLPLPKSSPRPTARHRRVKRGIVAGYLHDLTQRHGAGTAARPVELPRAVVAEPAER